MAHINRHVVYRGPKSIAARSIEPNGRRYICLYIYVYKYIYAYAYIHIDIYT